MTESKRRMVYFWDEKAINVWSYIDGYTVGYFSKSGNQTYDLARFWIEPQYGVCLSNLHANARLFLLVPEILELLEDLLPELILMKAGERAHVDIGRIESMLGRIDAAGPYTRTMCIFPYMGSYIYPHEDSEQGDHIISIYGVLSSGRPQTSEHSQMKAARTLVAVPHVENVFRNLLSGYYDPLDVMKIISYICNEDIDDVSSL